MTNLSYYNGDHWRHWIGPRAPESDPQSDKMNAEVKRVFTSNNLIRECINRHATTLAGAFPNWKLEGREGEAPEQTLMEAEAALNDWIERTQFGDVLEKAVVRLLVGTEVGKSHAYIRLYRPERFADVEDSPYRLWVHVADPGSVVAERDDDDFPESFIYSYKGGTETQTLDPKTGMLTITVEAEGDGGGSSEVNELDLGSRWTIIELQADSLITESIKQLQNALNLSLTMMCRNQDAAGFMERVLLNAEKPGSYEIDEATGLERFVPDPSFRVGPGQTAFVSGIPTGGADNPGYTTPEVVYRQPVDTTTFIDTQRALRELIYQEFSQGHILSSADGSVSGVSRQQQRQDHLDQVRRQRATIEHAVREVFSVVLQLINPDWGSLRPVVELQITSLLTPEERRENREDVAAGLLSKTSAMLRAGIADTDAEAGLIQRESKAYDAPMVGQLVSAYNSGAIDIERLTELLTWGGVTPEEEGSL